MLQGELIRSCKLLDVNRKCAQNRHIMPKHAVACGLFFSRFQGTKSKHTVCCINIGTSFTRLFFFFFCYTADSFTVKFCTELASWSSVYEACLYAIMLVGIMYPASSRITEWMSSAPKPLKTCRFHFKSGTICPG